MNRPLPSHSDVRIVLQAGPDSARLASRWLDAMIAGISHASTSSAASQVTQTESPAAVFERRPALPATNPGRYGWRFCALRPDGVLVAAFTGTVIDRGTFDADCPSCSQPPTPECVCGIHYMLRARDIIRYADGSVQLSVNHRVLQRIRDKEWAPALAYGVAVGAVEVDRAQYQNADVPSRRAARWHTLALLTPGASPALRTSLRARYDCPVTTDASLRACEAVAARLESSVPPAQMAEMAGALP